MIRKGTDMKKKNVIAVWIAAAAMACSAAPIYATGVQASPAAQMSPDGVGQSMQTWPIDQLIPLSVREAWGMSGKNEQTFFAMVKQLAELSAQKRAITLPDDKAAGEKAGEWIKKEAKRDPDQLLYVVVDRAVQYSAKVQAGTGTGTGTSTQK